MWKKKTLDTGAVFKLLVCIFETQVHNNYIHTFDKPKTTVAIYFGETLRKMGYKVLH